MDIMYILDIWIYRHIILCLYYISIYIIYRYIYDIYILYL